MIESDITDQIKEEVPAIEEAKVLLGLMNKPQAMHWLEMDYSVRNRWGPQLSEVHRQGVIEENKGEWEAIHEEAIEGLEAASPFRDHQVELHELPDDEEIQKHIAEFESSDYFQDSYGQRPPAMWSIKLVPIDCLVAFQHHVITHAHQTIPTSDDGLVDLIRYCLPCGVKNYLHVDGRTRQDYSSLRAVSRNPNINIDGPHIDTLEDRPEGNISVRYNIKARPNFVQVAHYQDRFILKNGYHRCYQLLEAGEEYVPAVVLYAQDYADTGAEWVSQNKILSARPPLVRDFLTDAAVTLETKGKNKMIRITAEKSDVER